MSISYESIPPPILNSPCNAWNPSKPRNKSPSHGPPSPRRNPSQPGLGSCYPVHRVNPCRAIHRRKNGKARTSDAVRAEAERRPALLVHPVSGPDFESGNEEVRKKGEVASAGRLRSNKQAAGRALARSGRRRCQRAGIHDAESNPADRFLGDLRRKACPDQIG